MFLFLSSEVYYRSPILDLFSTRMSDANFHYCLGKNALLHESHFKVLFISLLPNIPILYTPENTRKRRYYGVSGGIKWKH